MSYDYRQSQLDSVRASCLEAIDTMRRFLDEADRSVRDDTSTPEVMIGRTIHRLAWGLASASSGLTDAVSALQDARKVADLEKAANQAASNV
jgi:hypothetical protein